MIYAMASSPVSIKTLSTVLGLEREIIYTVSETVNRHYHPFDNLKYHNQVREAWRHIDNPTGALKMVQTRIQRRILRPYALNAAAPPYLVGGMPGRSIQDNAFPHINKPCVVSMDLTKCFEHINEDMVYDVFFNCLGFGRDAARVATKLTSFQGRLPQGSSASSILCAFALRKMAADIDAYCKAHGLSFTMYVDDITVSGSYEEAIRAIGAITNICNGYAMHVNKDKTDIMRSNFPQHVTGHSVNTRVGIGNEYIDDIRAQIIKVARPTYMPSHRELNSIWERIKYVRLHDFNKAQRLFDYACNRLQDIDGIARDIPAGEHRKCGDYHDPHIIMRHPMPAVTPPLAI